MPFREKTNNVNYLNPNFRTVINLIIHEIVENEMVKVARGGIEPPTSGL